MKEINELTGLYSVNKTVEFSAIPEPKTAELFNRFWENHTESTVDDKTNYFSKDKNLAIAKETMKVVLNNFHERFINYALSSKEIENYDFSSYLMKYRNKETDTEEGILSEDIGKTIHTKVESFIKQYISKLPKAKEQKFSVALGKHKKDKNYCSVFSIMEIRDLLETNPSLCPKEVSKKDYAFSLKTLQGFWHSMDTFTQNRENYYIFDKEQSTSVITRIVYDLLPTYCANILIYEEQADAYNTMFSALSRVEVEMKIKNPSSNAYEYITNVDLSIFEISRFGSTLTQHRIEKYNTEIAKLNEVVNLYNHQFAGKNEIKKLKPFSKLHKQIGCKPSIVPMSIRLEKHYEKDMVNKEKAECKSLESLINIIKDAVSSYTNENDPLSVLSFVKWIKCKDSYAGMYMTDKAIDTLLRKYMVDPYAVKESVRSVKSCTIYDSKKAEGVQTKWRSAVELTPLFKQIDKDYDFDTAFKPTVYKDYVHLLDSKKTISQNLLSIFCDNVLQAVDTATDFTSIKNLQLDDQNNYSDLFIWLDAVLDMCRMIKCFNVQKNKIKGIELDTEMMQYIEHILEPDWFGWYAAIDAFVCQKPQDVVKDNHLKLNFNTSSFMDGWSEGYENKYLSVIVKKDNLYYLCILTDKNLFSEHSPLYLNPSENAYRMVMKQLSFRTLTGRGYVSKYGKRLSEERDVQVAIQNIKDIITDKYITKYPKLSSVLECDFEKTSTMKDEIDFILAEYSQCVMSPINWDYLREQEENGGVFILRLYNKDYSPKSTGKKNLHTIFWEDLFTRDSLHRIGGKAELFVRDAVGCESDTITHRAGSFLLNKRDVNGNVIPNDIYQELYIYKNKNGKVKTEQAKELLTQNLVVFKEVKKGHEIVKDKRFYSGRKYTFHCAIKFNEGAEGFPKYPETVYARFDQKINTQMSSPTFLGIDRGEKHLVYWCLLNADGSINDCGNFDTINGTNYVQLLDDRANLRKKEQKERRQKSSIKLIKNSYVKLVTSEITKSAILPAITKGESLQYIVLEKLSKEMKGKRAHIEKQTYQILEEALASKLSFFVDKNLSEGPGSIKQPLQLVPPFNTFDDIDGKDSFGIMQYTRANYTSVTDPLTGWRQSIYIRGGKSEEVIQRIIAVFDDIRFDGKDYAFDYTDENTGKHWTLYSGEDGKPLDRFYGYVKESDEHHPRVDVVRILDALFANFDKTKSLRNQLVSGVELKKNPDSSRTAAEELRFAIKIIQQIRNTGNIAADNNYLQSPVRDSDGHHFDTRKSIQFTGLEKIKDGDANGAYNIARKGYLMYEHRKYWQSLGCPEYAPDKKKKKKLVSALNLFISDKEWDLWLQNKGEWEKNLNAFAIKK